VNTYALAKVYWRLLFFFVISAFINVYYFTMFTLPAGEQRMCTGGT